MGKNLYKEGLKINILPGRFYLFADAIARKKNINH